MQGIKILKSVEFYDWKLDSCRPVSWIRVGSSARGGKNHDMHSAVHLGIVLAGTHAGSYGNSEITLQSSEVYLTAPWEPHCTLPGSEDRRILLINLDDTTLENFFFTGREKLAALFAMPPVERMSCINQSAGRDALLANVFSWVAAVSFAYVTNRVWVFASTAKGAKAVLKELAAFFGGRLMTLGFEELVLFLLIHLAHWDSTLVKVLAQIGVLVLNFVISKWLVFTKKAA